MSLELLQDNSFDLESLLADLLAESFGRGMNEDLTVGDGKGKPKGIIEWATASDAAPSASAVKFGRSGRPHPLGRLGLCP